MKTLVNSSFGDQEKMAAKHHMRPAMVGSAIYVDGLHESMQKSRLELGPRIDARDLSDSEYEPSGISSYNSRSVLKSSDENMLPVLPNLLQRPVESRKGKSPPRDIQLPLVTRQSDINGDVVATDTSNNEGVSGKDNSKRSVHHLPHIKMVEKTKTAYENYCGKSTQDSVLACMDIASNFSTKPWLSQVRLAMSVHRNTIRRPLRARSKSDPTGRKVTELQVVKGYLK